jgi:hypothetical protein
MAIDQTGHQQAPPTLLAGSTAAIRAGGEGEIMAGHPPERLDRVGAEVGALAFLGLVQKWGTRTPTPLGALDPEACTVALYSVLHSALYPPFMFGP